MKKIWIAAAAVVALSGSMMADTISSGSGGFSAMPSGASLLTTMTPWSSSNITTNSQVPFFNNPSSDIIGGSHAVNVGDILTGSTPTLPNPLGADTVTQYFSFLGGSGPNGQDPVGTSTPVVSGGTTADGTPLAFSLVRNAVAYNISVLFADSSMDPSTTFGTYTGNTFTPIYSGVANNLTGTPSNVMSFNPVGNGVTYGFYATVCYTSGCETYTSGNGNSGVTNAGVNGGQAWNHFALFQLASGGYAIGFEDGNGQFTEGIGDFNDIVIELSSSSVPEPGTIAIMGLGLAGLGFLGRRRFAKK